MKSARGTTRRGFLLKSGLALGAGMFFGLESARPDVVERGGRKYADISIHCVDSRLRGTPWYDALEREGLKPYLITTPGASASPAVTRHIADLVRQVQQKHGRAVIFRINVVGHGTLERTQRPVEGGWYLNYEVSKDPKAPQCGMRGKGTFMQEVLKKMLEEGRKGKLWNGRRYVRVENVMQLEGVLNEYYGLESDPLYDFVRDNPPVHQHVAEQTRELEIALRKLVPAGSLQVYGGVEGHASGKTAYAYHALHALGRHEAQNRELRPEDSPLVRVYANAQQLFQAMKPADQARELEARRNPQHPVYHVIVDSEVKELAGRLVEKELKLPARSGEFFTTVLNQSKPDPLADASHAYWLLHLLDHAPAEVKRNATVVFVGNNPKNLEEALSNTPIGRLLKDNYPNSVTRVLHVKAR